MCASGEWAHRKLPQVGANDNSRYRTSQPGCGNRRHFGAGEEGKAKRFYLHVLCSITRVI